MTVRELIEELEGFEEDMEVSLAIQPNYPFEHSVGDIVDAGGKVYIGEDRQLDYLSGEATEALGWGR